MATYSEEGNLSLKAFNELHDTDVQTTFPSAVYETISDVLHAGALAVRSISPRKLIPEGSRVAGNGTANQYLKGTIFGRRETQSDVAIKSLIPKEDDLRTALKTALSALTFEGEKITNISFKLDNM